MGRLDGKDVRMLNLLQKDCRVSFTEMARQIGLSIDATKKRYHKMIEAGFFYPKIQLRPRQLGFPNIVNVRLKVRGYNKKLLREFIDYLTEHPRVPELFSVSGQWDYSLVIIARDNEDLAKVSKEIRERFSTIIHDWQESLTTMVYKFEQYDVSKLTGGSP